MKTDKQETLKSICVSVHMATAIQLARHHHALVNLQTELSQLFN